MESWTLNNAKPYMLVLVAIVSLITPFIKRTGNTLRNGQGSLNSRNIDSSILLCVIAYLIYIVFCVGKRVDLGIGSMDAYAYRENFYSAACSYSRFILDISSFEWGYSTVVWVVRQITSNYAVLLTLWYTISFYYILKFLCYTEQGGLSVLRVVVAAMTLLSQMNTMRMSIAIALSLNVLIQIGKKRWVSALVFSFLAISVQISSVIILPIVFVEMTVASSQQRRARKILMIILVSVLLIYASIPLLEKYVASTDKRVYLGASSLALGSYSAAAITILGTYRHRIAMTHNGWLNTTLMIALPCIFLCVPLQLAISVMYRLTLYFSLITITLMIGLAVNQAEGDRLSKMLWVALSVGYVAIQVYDFATVTTSYFGIYSNILF